MREDLASTSSPNHAPVPRLALGELLGRGTVTEVYRARDHVLDRPVAVKVFRTAAHPVARRRFDAEAYALARLSHPNLVSIFDIGTLDESPYLVMQLVDGDTLAARLGTGPLPEPITLRMGAALADGLAHAHEHGVVHCGVTPASILLDGEDAPHLTDFGAALLTDELPSSEPAETIDNSAGTAYAAPEQLGGQPIGPAVDVYALGMVLLECLNGDPGGSSDLLTAMTAREPSLRPSAADCARQLLALEADAALHQQPAPIPCPVESVRVAPESDDMGRTAVVPRPRRSPATGRRSPATMLRARRPVVMLAGAAAITAAVTLTLANMDRPVAGHPSGSVVVGAQSGHDSAHASSNTPVPAGVRAGSTPAPDGTLLVAPVTGHAAVVGAHQFPEQFPDPTRTTPTAPSPVVATTAPPATTSAPGPTPTTTPAATTEPSPSDVVTGNPGTGSP
jgi:eukaryotic-like serine/threonine-protein kinase